jgi:hypothetical protein
MRSRILLITAMTALLALLAGCAAGPSQAPTETPAPVKTLRPTFTITPAEPTAVPPTATPEIPPTETPEPDTPTPEVPPTETPEPTPEAATLRVTSNVANVRSGPGTGFGRIGQVNQGQTFEVTGKNSAGDWYEFDLDGKTAWIYSQMVSVDGADLVAVADNVPALPTARPTARPAAAQPTAQPAAPQPAPATYQFAAVGPSPYPNNNDYLTVRCRTVREVGSGKGPEGILLVNGPGGSKQVNFGTILNRANTGMEKNMEYMYNENCKIEIGPFVAGDYTGMLVDGSGKQISDPITFNASGDQREFMLIWNSR